MQENPKAYDPSYIKIYDEEASNQEGAFCTKYVKKINFAKSGPGPDLETTQYANKLWNLMLTALTREQEEKSKNMNTPGTKANWTPELHLSNTHRRTTSPYPLHTT